MEDRKTKEEEDLIAAIGEHRDRKAFEELFGRYQSLAYGLARSLTGNEALAEDSCQEAMIQIWRTAARYSPEGRPRNWILKIVSHCCFKALRRSRGREVRLEMGETSGSHQRTRPDEPQERAIHNEQIEAIYRLLNDMAPTEKRLILLRFVAGFKQDEIGALVGLPQTTISSKLRKSLQHLRAKLVQAGFASAVALLNEDGFARAVEAHVPRSQEFFRSFWEREVGISRRAFPQAVSTPAKIAAYGLGLLLVGGVVLRVFLGPVRVTESAPRPQGRPSHETKAAPAFERVWTFEDKTVPGISVIGGTFNFAPEAGDGYRLETQRPDSMRHMKPVLLLMPPAPPDRSLLLAVHARVLDAKHNILSQVRWTDGEKAFACRSMKHKRSPPPGPRHGVEGGPALNITFHVHADFTQTSVNGRPCYLHRYADLPPRRRLLLSIANMAVRRIEFAESESAFRYADLKDRFKSDTPPLLLPARPLPGSEGWTKLPEKQRAQFLFPAREK